MKTFNCQRCDARVFFENVSCDACGARLGFIPSELAIASFERTGHGIWLRWTGRRRHADDDSARPFEFCANGWDGPVGCNWVVDAADAGPLCVSCRATRTHPVLDKGDNRARWARIEAAKRQLVCSLLAWGLPFPCKRTDPRNGVAFDFLEQTDPSKRFLTGHRDGVITLDIAEADDAQRERVRAQMGEPCRTLLGHLRHEIGHYYWDRLVRGTAWAEAFRRLFGDERADYAGALARHYRSPRVDWRQRHVSAYASAHPWEDWAECWAHYMMLQDGLDTAAAWGLQLHQALPGGPPVRAQAVPLDGTPLRPAAVQDWLPISQFVNAMCRSVGSRDGYPFVMTDAVVEKIGFIHEVVGAAVRGEVPMNFAPPALAGQPH